MSLFVISVGKSLTYSNQLDTFALNRYFTEDTVDPIAIVAGLVQTALFSDFFYIYFTK